MNTKVIAEIGWNHMGDNDLAEKMIFEAKNSGADIVKFQYWNPKLLRKGSWDQDGRREIYEKAALSEDKINFLKSSAKDNKCSFLISVFGTKGAMLIKNMGIETIKIPSHEIANEKLLKFCSLNFKEIFLSAGAASSKEVIKAVRILKASDCIFFLMHCVSSYPCPEENSNLLRINWLKTIHDRVGLSDHTQGLISPSIAVSMGAEVIEKHFTINKNLPGRDNKFALDPSEFRMMTKNILSTEKALINHGIENQEIELDTINNYRGRWEPQDYKNTDE